MKIVAIVLLAIGLLMLTIYPAFLLSGALGAPFILIGFSGLAYLKYRIQIIQVRLNSLLQTRNQIK